MKIDWFTGFMTTKSIFFRQNTIINTEGTCCRRSVSAFETFETLQGYSDTPTAEQQLTPTNSWRTAPVDEFHLVPIFKPIGIS